MIVIRGAEVYDFARAIHGKVQDVWVEGERVIAPPVNPGKYKVIDGRGCILAPAGIEIHSHFSGYGLDSVRRFLSANSVALDMLAPSPEVICERYLKLGYTTLLDAASSPLFSMATHHDLEKMHQVDRGTYTLMGDHAVLLEALAKGVILQLFRIRLLGFSRFQVDTRSSWSILEQDSLGKTGYHYSRNG